MKKAVFTAGLVLVTVIAIAFTTQTKVPQAVLEAFVRKFPDAKNVNWDKENASEWEAEFKWNGLKYSANFLEDGAWQETEHRIKESEVPQNVLASLKTNFPGYEIEEAEISEKPNTILYEFGIEKGGNEMEVTIDKTGTVINKKMEEEEDGDDED